MRKLSILGAAAVLVSAAALPSIAHAACAMYDPNCHTYPPMSSATSNPRAAKAEASPAETRTIQRHERYRTADRRAYNRGPDEVVGGTAAAAGGVVAGAANTAGAIATAPFRGSDSYAYYNGPYSTDSNVSAGWPRQSYAERNGLACTPGTYFRSADGRRHLCQ